MGSAVVNALVIQRQLEPGWSLQGDGTPTKPCSTKLATEHKVFPNRNAYKGTWREKRMHGDGLYTWSDGSEYAGEFKEGSVWGQGEKRWPNGRKYRGEWVRDMMWGDGEMVWPSGETFTGQFRKGIYHGKGMRVWPGGDWYAGEFKNGEQEGEGTFESASEGWIYNGRWLHGRMSGEGRVTWPSGIAYVGAWRDGIREGHGKLTWPDGSWYEGQFRNDCIEGRGRKFLPDNSWFDGHFHDGELEGNGTFHWANGTEFEGLWHGSKIVGPGRHKFPDGTTITGVFDDRGASGEGTKCWASGCTYTGLLRQNKVHHHGVLKWPDGRCYVGRFQDEMMHGQGVLTWADKDGICRYKGSFQGNRFHGDGVLEFSNTARYEGQFEDGLYHGEGVFEWPDSANVYRGQWERGEMSNRGVLAIVTLSSEEERGGPLVYVGDFKDGHMDGTGTANFLFRDGSRDIYEGEFVASKIHGHGRFEWCTGHTLSGFFEEGYCRFGEKVYESGQVYVGELKNDLEHGNGVLADGQFRVAGVWRKGRCSKELLETFVSLSELDVAEGPQPQKVFSGVRSVAAPDPAAGQQCDVAGNEFNGEAIVAYANGDKYVGCMKGGRKDGLGMYVYSDLTAYKGQWVEDQLDGTMHPLPEEQRPEQAIKLQKVNETNQERIEYLKVFPARQLRKNKKVHASFHLSSEMSTMTAGSNT